MTLVIPDEIIKSTKMSITELTQEIAIMLYQKGKITLNVSFPTHIERK